MSSTGYHPRLSLDPLIHRPITLSIVSALSAVDEADFATIRDIVVVSDSALSKQITALEQARYLKVRKAFVGRRTRTYLSLTTAGRAALAAHRKALWAIVGEDVAEAPGAELPGT
ncbi:DNA-binding MarR family transcriptional regulator [Krasilnikovia cinnamomea]|uniref:DNA-binding MarR family transcriptional regulator n=1 Tax=Krasilnikovia cinnamomea TaxID=349313 RepID=A0A4Q7ZKY8_9ACTN|nr:transcriptional regulator [Krasilnikovia cinnamomea]RZU51231.1 DNA-binding MarR family transcriptional regulator [Krasilnikovia cinnamomea]